MNIYIISEELYILYIYYPGLTRAIDVFGYLDLYYIKSIIKQSLNLKICLLLLFYSKHIRRHKMYKKENTINVC